MHILGLILIILGVVWIVQGAVLGGILVVIVGVLLGGNHIYTRR
jgi:hypothetical protein